MGLYKADWGLVLLRYIYILVFYCKQFDACMYTACQGICINVENFLKTFLDHSFYNLGKFIFL